MISCWLGRGPRRGSSAVMQWNPLCRVSVIGCLGFNVDSAGGLGLAAVQVAAAAGAEALGTAGSASKRAHLRGLGVRGVASSRSLDFAEAFAAPGRRPNVVLNSLTSPGKSPSRTQRKRVADS